MKQPTLLLATVLVMVVNGIVLAGVRHNRSGEPDAVVELTERELRLGPADRENSAVSLQLTLHREHDGWSKGSAWFDRRKLEELGFDCRLPPQAPDAGRRYDRALPRRAWVVLEYEGAAWKAWKEAAGRRMGELTAQAGNGGKNNPVAAESRRLARQLASSSRLFAVDAGRDAAALRRRYPDRRRCIITPALVRQRLVRGDDKGNAPYLAGYVEQILTDDIQVPRDLRGGLASLAPSPPEYQVTGQVEKGVSPRYRVTLTYGRRHEPWVTAVRPFRW